MTSTGVVSWLIDDADSVLTIDWTMMALHGGIFALVASIYVMTALARYPRWFLRHYPEEIRAAAAPLTPEEKRTGRLVGLPFMALLIGVPLASTCAFARVHAEASFLAQLVHGFGVFMVFNIVDLLVLDLLWLGLFTPAWAAIPGTEGVAYRFNTLHHLRGFVSGTLMAAVVGLFGALLF